MKAVAANSCRKPLIMAFFLLYALSASGQQITPEPTIPPRFNLDFQTAAHFAPRTHATEHRRNGLHHGTHCL